MHRRIETLGCFAVLWMLVAGGPARADQLRAFGRIECVPSQGVQFCQGSAPVSGPCPAYPVPCATEIYDPLVPDTRVPSWDGTPLDVNVTLPLHASGDLPLIILIHGFASVKVGLDTSYADPWTWSGSREWALRGYAVLSYSSRGQGNSCGWPASRVNTAACDHGYQHLNDLRYEVRDTQYLAGLLADQGIVNPQKIGVTGGSWGGGESVDLATLRNRTMLPDGQLVPWVSPQRHVPMQIAAAAPIAAWSDLALAAAPNGHDLDYTLTPPDEDTATPGILKLSVLDSLYAVLALDSYFPPPGVDPPVTAWVAMINAPWPAASDGNPAFASAAKSIGEYHGASLVPDNEAPAPTLYANGWNDDIFTVTQELNWVNRELSAHPRAQISMLLGDWGHQRSQNKPADTARLHAAIVTWFSHYLLGTKTPALRGVEALTTTCPASGPSGGPYFAPSWPAIHPGEVRYAGSGTQTVNSLAGSALEDAALDPIAGPGACASPSDRTVAGTATYDFPVTGRGFTMIGSPTVIADLQPSGRAPYPSIAAHLFVIRPGGSTEELLARQTYRAAASGLQVFQLYPQAYTFAPGDIVKLELAGQDAPYSEPDLNVGTITVSDLQLRLPVVEQPNCTTILGPAAPVVPAGEKLAPGVRRRPHDVCPR
ncbi:MAG TPA: CocE/NonD family hydrolase [Solirubrobacteraceae bacterium]|nr:CocE/NonD family hydrolase [Solirubrobacteraceae bacterium]